MRLCGCCGAPYLAPPPGSGHPVKFCSDACRIEKAIEDRRQATIKYTNKKNRRACVECGAHFTRAGNVGSRTLCLACDEKSLRACTICCAEFAARDSGSSSCYCTPCRQAMASHYRHGTPRPERKERPCPHCLAMFTPTGRRVNTYCSPACSKDAQRSGTVCVLVLCEKCSLPCRAFAQACMKSLCLKCRAGAVADRRGVSEARRRDAERNGDSDIHWSTVGPRDLWRCHICGCKVRQVAGTAMEPQGATVDHLLPIVDGGPHAWENVALAHRSCNVRRQAGGIVQLRLVG